MLRNIDISEISNGTKYRSNDCVRISCNDCNGCSSCCHDMGNSIILDPYDIYELSKATGNTFDILLKTCLELNMVDGVILPNIKMQANTNACIFLSDKGRCSIHDNRPGFCRLFPLGRIYENDSFSYFNQIHECDYPNKSKIKIKKWLGIPNLNAYEKYILNWHDYLREMRFAIDDAPDLETEKEISMQILNIFFVKPYDLNAGFYEQYYDRLP